MEHTPRTLASVLVTGGAGFIGSSFIRHLLADAEFSGRVAFSGRRGL